MYLLNQCVISSFFYGNLRKNNLINSQTEKKTEIRQKIKNRYSERIYNEFLKQNQNRTRTIINGLKIDFTSQETLVI